MRKSSVLVLVAILGFAGFVFYALSGVEPVKVMGTRLERKGGQVAVAGTVENTGSATAAIDLEVRYYDAGGRTLASDMLTMRDLKSGERRGFETHARDLPAAANFSIYLNHGRNPYGN